MKKKTIKVATFNVLNLLLPEVEYYDNKKYTQIEYERKIDWIAGQLIAMNADIVGFQEVFQLEALQAAVERSGIYKGAHIIGAKQDGILPRLAILSRFPISASTVYENFPEDSLIELENHETSEKITLPYKKFSRPVLQADIKVHEDFIISFFVVHLKSKRPGFINNENRDNPVHLAKGQTRSLLIRSAEATALRSILSATMKGNERPVILMGDVNDNGISVSTRIVSGEIPFRKLPSEIKQNVWDVLLYHVKDLQARKSFHDFYYTHVHNGHYESLDHIMVSQELVSENPRSIGRVGYVSLLNDHLFDSTLSNEKPKSWQSDHGQVSVTIELNLDRIEHLVSQKL
jgi:endonuclease/exonuclease/phosphatase family metal-dependent hydrolase